MSYHISKKSQKEATSQENRWMLALVSVDLLKECGKILALLEWEKAGCRWLVGKTEGDGIAAMTVVVAGWGRGD